MTPLLLALAVLQQADSGAPGARDRRCVVVVDSIGGVLRQVEVGPGVTNWYANTGVWARCEGTQSTLYADSTAWYGAARRFDMVGNVRIRDSTLALDSRFAAYYVEREVLEARNNVVAVNRSTRSTLRGPNVTHLRAATGVRDTTEMFASGRPTIEYRAESDTAEPYVIVADRVRFKGNDRMWGGGRVTIDRSDLAARADSMFLDEAAGVGALIRQPRIEGRRGRPYTLVGTRIDLALAGREIERTMAHGAGEATGDDWRLTADTIHLHIRDSRLQQVFAWGDSTRPHAESTENTVVADSLALDTPDERLDEIRAFGRALSTTRRDTAAAADVDWIAGDTLVARFAQATDSTGETAPELREIVARGAARALTHHDDEADEACPPSINYSRGATLAVALRGERIDRVLVTGQTDGVHLECQPPPPPSPAPPPPPPPPADTTRAGGPPT